MTNRSTGVGSTQFRNMLRVAQEIGSQIQVGTENPNILTGLCPFHESKNLHEAKTLRVNLVTARFWCISCHVAGNPLAFLAKIWGVSGNDAYEFVREGYEITVERPRRRERENSPHGNVALQNTALLTMATRHYGQQVKQSFDALHYLARLGIEPDSAIRAGFGYCTGEGLTNYLEEKGADPEEMEESPLFQDITGMEFLTNCITLSDLDYTGATVWIAGLLPEEDNKPLWNESKPRIRGVRGKRNRFFNFTNIWEHEHGITVTDDPRLYLIMKASEMTPLLFTALRTEGNSQKISALAGSTLLSREPADLIMAMHDRETQAGIVQKVKEIQPNLPCEHRSRREMMEQLNPQTRDLRRFIRMERPNDPGARSPADPRETIPRSAGNGAASPPPAATGSKDPGKGAGEKEAGSGRKNRNNKRNQNRKKNARQNGNNNGTQNGNQIPDAGEVRTEEIPPARHQPPASANAGTL